MVVYFTNIQEWDWRQRMTQGWINCLDKKYAFMYTVMLLSLLPSLPTLLFHPLSGVWSRILWAPRLTPKNKVRSQSTPWWCHTWTSTQTWQTLFWAERLRVLSAAADWKRPGWVSAGVYIGLSTKMGTGDEAELFALSHLLLLQLQRRYPHNLINSKCQSLLLQEGFLSVI